MDLILLLIFITPVLAVKTDPKEDYYHAAVVEFCPYEGKDANDTMITNAKEYVRLIQQAAKTADIVVFPEYGLNYWDDTLFMELPFGKNEPAPADNPKLHPVVRMISQAARDNEIYVSICLLEKDLTTGEELKYNSNIVFDRKGVIISKYRKFNLYNEDVNATKVPDLSIFETDFGVRFGSFICADIFHKEPGSTLVYEKNIRDFVYPNWFGAELKLGLSVQIHFGWAYMTDSNFLSAGINSLQEGSTGSGIFAGRDGPVINIISEKNETRVLTGKVYKKGRTDGQQKITRKPEGRILEPLTPGVDSTHKMEAENFQNYSTILLTPNEINELTTGGNGDKNLNKIFESTICQGSLCCEFNANITFTFKPLEDLNKSDISYLKNDSFYHYQYRFGAYDGIKGFEHGQESKGIQVCAIIPCLDDSLSSCWKKTGNVEPLIIHSKSFGDIILYSTTFNKFFIKSVTKEATDFTFPNLVDSSKSSSLKAFGSAPDVSKMDFNFNKTSSHLTYSSDRLIYASLYSRIMSRDGGEPSA